MKKEKSCGCVVFNDKFEVLLIHMNQGHWSFPKGHVEKNESEIETALRETLEETNIKVDIDKSFRKVTNYSLHKGVWKDVVFFIGKASNDEIIIQKEELKDAKFVGVEEAKKLITYRNDLDILFKAIEHLNIGK